jgi:hypothetical protein
MRVAIVALLPLAACMPGEEATPAPPGEDACGAAALQDLVGEPVAGHEFDSNNRPVRIIPPGTAVTMDFNPERLNVETDADGVIVRIYCG